MIIKVNHVENNYTKGEVNEIIYSEDKVILENLPEIIKFNKKYDYTTITDYIIDNDKYNEYCNFKIIDILKKFKKFLISIVNNIMEYLEKNNLCNKKPIMIL